MKLYSLISIIGVLHGWLFLRHNLSLFKLEISLGLQALVNLKILIYFSIVVYYCSLKEIDIETITIWAETENDDSHRNT